MKRPFHPSLLLPVFLIAVSQGYGQATLLASARVPSKTAISNSPAGARGDSTSRSLTLTGKKRADILTKYEQACALRFFEFCDYLLAPPDIIIDSASYSGGEKKEEIVMQRERAGDTARIKKAVLRYTVMPQPTDTTDSLHFSQEELSDQDYRKLESAFSTMEKLLDSFYNAGAIPLKLVPLRLHDNASIRSQLGAGNLASTFLLRRGKQTLAVLLFTPQNRMTPTKPPRICGWAVDFRRGRMIFHRIAGSGHQPVVYSH